jgi:aminoglycoside phosphotransferase (APT) family kinase protein
VSGLASRPVGALVRDPETTARQLTEWLTRVAGLRDVIVGEIEIPAATGFSNETILFDAEWRDGDAERASHRLVVRIAPQSYTVFLEANFEAQFRVMHALGEHTDVPIPKMLWFEDDPAWFGSPFWIMERVDGQVPSDAPPYALEGWLHDASPEQQAELWWNGIAAMAAVHRVDWRALGLDFVDDPDRGKRGVEQQLRYYEEALAWAEAAEDGRPHPGARAALEWLAEHMPDSPPDAATIVWGDARLGNQMSRDGQIVAVLDWEMVALGDPRIDLGWWIFCDDVLSTGTGGSRLPGFPSAAATVERWEALTGRQAGDLQWFLVFAALRFTVVMLRLSTLLTAMGYSPEPFGYDNPISNALDELLAAT